MASKLMLPAVSSAPEGMDLHAWAMVVLSCVMVPRVRVASRVAAFGRVV